MSERALRTVDVTREGGPVPLVPNGAMGMLIFVFTELMLFAGLVSAFTIVRSSAMMWPPDGQPRLPFEETAVNTLALLASGVLLFIAHRAFRRGPALANWPLLLSMFLGACFVALQGVEWVALIGEGLTVTSSVQGSFFYLIIGLHALHAVAALGLLAYAWLRLQARCLSPELLVTAEVLWYFVVAVWPLLYLRVYL